MGEIELHSKTLRIKGTVYTCYWVEEYNQAECRAYGSVDGGQKILNVSYGYFAGPDQNVRTVVDHLRKLLIRVYVRHQLLGEYHKMVIQRENFRLRGETRSCIDPEFEEDEFIDDEEWDNKVSEKIQRKLFRWMQVEGSPFRVSFSADSSLAESYIASLSDLDDSQLSDVTAVQQQTQNEKKPSYTEKVKQTSSDKSITSSMTVGVSRYHLSSGSDSCEVDDDVSTVEQAVNEKASNACKLQELKLSNPCVSKVREVTSKSKKTNNSFRFSVASLLKKRPANMSCDPPPREQEPNSATSTVGSSKILRLSTGPLKLLAKPLFHRPDDNSTK